MSIKDELKKEIEIVEKEEKHAEESSYFWGYLTGGMSFFNGLFLIVSDGILATRMDTYLFGIDEDLFGWLLMIFGAIKVIGILADLYQARLIGIVGLTAVWLPLFVLSLIFSFGIGYPSNAFLSNLVILIACLRVSYKGAKNK